ncbi:deubiquitinating protein VCIP135 [Denticeps clupeoides]|uniref:Deubiquitinating protein VCPIP1 n=1 Tax=Denticeps clupeoides TaxID=299321 RepID=A0AAY4AJD1_9TELE|nr:deubiquitinating protein VCIP135 [Denticeps clupeoides]
MSLMQGSKKKDKRILSGTCPDPKCQARLFFPAYGSVSIECTECGQRHEQKNLLNVEEVTDPDVVLHNLLRNALLGVAGAPKKGTDLVKVMGLSNYHCKLLSPVLTRYGMDKQSGKAKLLVEMNQGEMFDCALLGDRAFLIEPEHVSTVGYGKDRSGSLIYLHDTLEEVKKANGHRECLIPVHVDGDGHCLVHAVSRALVGRELFWHALRENLKQNFKQNLDRYKALFQDFIDSAEWEDIINECDPLFTPPEGVPLGLRNIHIFGLANVLHRPIILLDSLSGMRSSGDYSATFLPGLVPEEQCRGKDGALNKPICIAWSSSGRNHYIPLVGIKNTDLPRLPARLLPKAWGVPQELIPRYVSLDVDCGCVIGGDRGLQEKYLMRLVSAMEEVFMEKHGIHPSLVADVHQYVYRRTGVIGVQPEEVTAAAKRSVSENRLHRCLVCGALSELHVPAEWLAPGGKLYNLAKTTHGQLRPDKNYSFPLSSVVCSYDAQRDILVPDYKLSALSTCHWCHAGSVRHVRSDGSVAYLNGDRTNTRSDTGGKCGCGFKHFWEEREYDNLPEAFPITLEWGGRVVRETVYWFQYESQTSLNSNVYDVAMRLVTKHFPGEFGSELLVQKVVNTILHHTAKRDPNEYHPVNIEGAHAHSHVHASKQPAAAEEVAGGGDLADAHPPTKIILTGQKGRTLHKEELTMSRTERSIQQSVREHAPVAQRKRTEFKEGQARSASSPSSSAPATPTKTASASSGEKKIRVTTSDGRQAMLTLRPLTSYAELQRSIAAEFGVPPQRQYIRYGFPPRELPPPPHGAENEPVALQHGDRVTVEVLKGGEGEAAQGDEKVDGGREEDERRRVEEDISVSRTNRDLQDNIDLEMSSLCLLATLMGEDVWSYAKKLPHLFQLGGVFYNIVKKDMGLLDGKHCTLPHLSGKTFVYNACDDRLELCVDAAGHFPISPSVDELAKEAVLQLRSEAQGHSHEGSPSHGSLRLGSGGVIRKKEPVQNVTAFQGKGHSLGSSPTPPTTEHRPITRQHSSGVDLSSSASRSPDLAAVSERAERELVRMAPGFVTAVRDGRGLDPVAIEAQRRRLQEMVSSIQASMDKHLKEHTRLHSHTVATDVPVKHDGKEREEAEQMEDEAAPTEPMDQS